MELRSKRKIVESRALENMLSGLGMYEDGMQLEEMQQIMQALQQSEQENETVFLNNDMERALKESELDFTQMQRDAHNSTMIDCNANTPRRRYGLNQHRADASLSPISSPEMAKQTLTIQVEVHHPHDWSPCRDHKVLELEGRTQRKRIATVLSTTEDAIECRNLKRSRLMSTKTSPIHGHNNDSGIHSSSTGSTDGSMVDAHSHSFAVTTYISHDYNEK